MKKSFIHIVTFLTPLLLMVGIFLIIDSSLVNSSVPITPQQENIEAVIIKKEHFKEKTKKVNHNFEKNSIVIVHEKRVPYLILRPQIIISKIFSIIYCIWLL